MADEYKSGSSGGGSQDPEVESSRAHRSRLSVKSLPSFSQLDDPATAAVRWRKWLAQLENYFVVTRESDSSVKRSTMLLMAGEELSDLLEDLPVMTMRKR